MRYPPWLPYPRYILKSFLLILEAGLAIAIGQVAIGLIALPLVLGGGLGIVEAIALLWVLLWVLIAPIYIFALVDRLIWHRPKAGEKLGWIPSNRNCGEGIFAYCALIVGFGIPGIIAAIATGDLSPKLTDEQTTALAIVAITIMSYLYQWGGTLWRWQQTTFKPKPKPKPARRQPTSKVRPVLSKPMTEIDRELEQMKRELREK